MGTALITGASAGLGIEFAKLFAHDGHSVILVARRRDKLDEVARQIKSSFPKIEAHVIDMDLGTIGAGEQLFQKIKSKGLSVDFLVNNAGFGTTGSYASSPLPGQLQMMDLNMRTLAELTHLFLPAMLQKKFGRILNVGSTAGFQPGPGMTTYYATKAFVNHFSEGLHEELLGTGVSCTVLAPGPTATEFGAVAGNDKSALFRTAVAGAESVAKVGYRAMHAGCAVAIAGLMNKISYLVGRLSPRFAVRKIAGLLNRVD